jgi:hypothetical protein
VSYDKNNNFDMKTVVAIIDAQSIIGKVPELKEEF